MPRPLHEYQENIAAEMLEDLAELTGIPIEDIFASEVETPLSNYEVSEIYGEETDSEELDLETSDRDIDDYLDDYVEERDIGDEEDAYGDEAL